jgi:hypothetical protein
MHCFKYLFSSKTLVLAALLALIVAEQTTAQTTDIVWSQPVSVASASFGAASPKIGKLENGRTAAVWGKTGSSPKIYFTTGDGTNFEPPVQLNTGGVDPDIYGFGGLDLAVFGDKIFVVFENFDAGIHLLRSEDGGATFLPPVTVFDPPPIDWTTLASIAVDGQGNPIISVIRELSTEINARYIVLRSENGGESFLPPVVASEPADGEYVCECCPSDMVVAGDSIWLVFRNNFNNLRDIWVSRSDDLAASFTTACDVDATDWMLNSCPISGPQLQKIGNDSLLAVWMSGATGQSRIYAATLHGGTMTKGWQFDFPVTNANGLQVFPAVGGSGDTLCVVWEESGFGTNGGELVYKFSQTGAQGLVQYTAANLTQAVGNQKYPSLTFKDGVFHLLYQSSGALEYRSGHLAIINGASQQFGAVKPFELMANPANSAISLRAMEGGKAQLGLYNATGQPVQQWTADFGMGEMLQLPLANNINSGLYFLRIEKEGRKWVEKVVVR